MFNAQLEQDFWRCASALRANSDLKASEYSTPVLGLIFLFADNHYRQFKADIRAEYKALKGTRREKLLSDIAIEKCRFYPPENARHDYLLALPEQHATLRGATRPSSTATTRARRRLKTTSATS